MTPSPNNHSLTLSAFLIVETALVSAGLWFGGLAWLAVPLAFLIWHFGLSLNRLLRPFSKPNSPRLPNNILRRAGSFHKTLTDSLRRSVLFLSGLFAVAILWLSLPHFLSTFPTSPHQAVPATIPVILLLAGALLAFLEIFRGLRHANEAETSPDFAAQLGHWRLLSVLHIIAAAVLFTEVYLKTPFHHFLALGLGFLTILSVGETLIRAIARLYIPRRMWHESPPLEVFFFTKWWGAPYNAAFPSREEFEDAFALKLPEMWMWPTVRRAVLPMVLCVGGMAWIASGFHEIPHGHKGVLRTFGAMSYSPLEPGLHITLPKPFAAVEAVSTSRFETLTLGFQSDPGEPILWEKSHYIGEEHILVGGGDDFLAISVPILHRISDPVAHAKNLNDSGDLLASLARRALLQEAVRLSSFEIMTTRREELRARLKKDLQSALDQRESGIEIVEVYLRDIHPPVEAAGAFQEVMSAMEDKEAQIHTAEAQANQTLPRARATAFQTDLEARQKSASRVLRAQGQTARFTMLATAFNKNPEAARIRESFQAIDDTLSGAKKLVMDTRFQSELPAYIDLRKVLNPDFINASLPEKQTLVPDIPGFRSAFDMEIEGFLMRGKGELPAVNMNQLDPDLNETE